MKNKNNFTTYILWLVYAGLLLVLLPHTAWGFRNWEPSQQIGKAWSIYGNFTSSDLLSYIAAFAFESATAALTHKLSERIELTPKGKKGWHLFVFRYVNPISLGLFATTAISMMANLAHAVQFSQSMKIFDDWGISPKVYSLAFGGVLPLISLLFAWVLSDVTESEDAPNPELIQAIEHIKSLRSQVKDAEARVKGYEERARLAEDRFGAVADMAKMLFAEDKRQRIIFVHKQWPQLPGSAIALITESSPSYVSETLKEIEVSA
jgi:hypothetical protein